MKAYYNEIEPYAVQWLKNLIAAGLIMDGDVDPRPIQEVRPNDLTGYVRCHFFVGIAGWDLALQLAGWPCDAPVWTGSCPCQPFSVAGKRKGTSDERHLWPEFRRLIEECGPPVVFGEQVASKDGRVWLAGVRSDLEALGYGVGAADLCAAGIGAPHIRQRLYWVGGMDVSETSERRSLYNREKCSPSTQVGGPSLFSGMANNNKGLEGWGALSECLGERVVGENGLGCWSNSVFIPCADGKARRIGLGIVPLVDGVPGRVGQIRAYGNAIVPPLAAEFIKSYMEVL
jgi:DNA (cytosine-5)-methyltransferase 1